MTTKRSTFDDSGSQQKVLGEIVNLIKSSDPQLLKQAGLQEAAGAGISEKDFEKYFDVIWSGPNRLSKVAMVLTDPLKERRDYFGVGRQILKPWSIGVGDIPYADKDIREFAAVISGGFGDMPIIEYKSRRVLFPTYELKRAYPVPYGETYIRRFNVFNRAKERVAIANAIAEDSEVFRTVDLASHVGPNDFIGVTGVGAYLNKTYLSQAISVLENNQLGAETLLISPTRFAEIRRWGSDLLDPVTLNQLNETGRIDRLMGLNVVMSAKVDPNAAYVLTSPDKLGRLVERKSAEVKVMDHVLRSTYYVCTYAIEGFGIHNSYGVVRLEFNNRTKGDLTQIYNKTPQMVSQLKY